MFTFDQIQALPAYAAVLALGFQLSSGKIQQKRCTVEFVDNNDRFTMYAIYQNGAVRFRPGKDGTPSKLRSYTAPLTTEKDWTEALEYIAQLIPKRRVKVAAQDAKQREQREKYRHAMADNNSNFGAVVQRPRPSLSTAPVERLEQRQPAGLLSAMPSVYGIARDYANESQDYAVLGQGKTDLIPELSETAANARQIGFNIDSVVEPNRVRVQTVNLDVEATTATGFSLICLHCGSNTSTFVGVRQRTDKTLRIIMRCNNCDHQSLIS